MRILITGPALTDEGGVAAYYNAVLPHLRERAEIDYLEIGASKAARPWHRATDQLRFARAVRRTRPSLVHVNPSLNFKSFVRDGLFVRRARSRGVPVLVFFRGWEEAFEQRVERRLRWFFARTYGHANRFVVLASAFGDRLRAWGVTAPVDVATTTFASELLDAFSIADRQRGLHDEQPLRVLFLARVVREKGVFETIEAIGALQARGVDVALTIAGDGAALPDVRRIARANDRIDVVGDVRGAEKRRLFATHHIYCCPSYSEGMPNSVIEAMALGMPVVTCATGGLRDIFEDGAMGTFVEPRSSTAVAAALAALAGNRRRMAAIATHNHERALERFAAPAVAQRLVTAYASVAGGR